MKKVVIGIFILCSCLGILPSYAVVNNNPALKELTINQGTINPVFDYLTTNYTVVVPEITETVEIQAIPVEETSKVEIKGEKNLKMGLNTFEILVTAEDGITKRTYTVTITRGNIEKANTNLKSLVIQNKQLVPNYTNTITEYVVVIPKEETSLAIQAIPENEKVSIEIIGNANLVKQDQIVKIKITAEDKITQKEIDLLVTKGEANLEEQEDKPAKQSNTEETKPNFWFAKYVAFSMVLVILLCIILRMLQIKRKEIEEKEDEK